MQLINDLLNTPRATKRPEPPVDLVFIDENTPGIRRKRHGSDFIYRHAETGSFVNAGDRSRIESLGIPPAWRTVWICPEPNGYLQATGLDEGERKQYRYHPAWRAYRERTKFHSLTDFGAKLPRIRRRIRRVFSEHSQPDAQLVTAALVRLLDNAPLRIGNAAYADSALGASTLKKRNVQLAGRRLHLDYTAKGGKRVRRQIKDSRLLQILDTIDDLPGKALFRYVGPDGDARQLRSEQVNSWLQKITASEHITAKTFRTWAGSLAAFERAVDEETLTIKAMSVAAAKELRNTPAVARKSYIHPAIVELKKADFDARKKLRADLSESACDLTLMETAMLRFLAKPQSKRIT